MEVLKRFLRVLVVLLATYVVACAIETVILVTIMWGGTQSQGLTINTADVISLYVIWMVLYFVVGRRYVRRKRSA
jgi:hypothetical protein